VLFGFLLLSCSPVTIHILDILEVKVKLRLKRLSYLNFRGPELIKPRLKDVNKCSSATVYSENFRQRNMDWV
jgi:hypothetical protein